MLGFFMLHTSYPQHEMQYQWPTYGKLLSL